MSEKMLCQECLQGLDKLGYEGKALIEARSHLKSPEYFTYADSICNGCVNFLTSDRGEFPGAPKEQMKDLMFLWNYFNWLFKKIKSEAPDTEEAEAKFNLVYANKRKFITLTMKRLNKDPEGLKEIMGEMCEKICVSITGQSFVIQQRMVQTNTGRR